MHICVCIYVCMFPSFDFNSNTKNKNSLNLLWMLDG